MCSKHGQKALRSGHSSLPPGREPRGSGAESSHCPQSPPLLPWAQVGPCGQLMWSPRALLMGPTLKPGHRPHGACKLPAHLHEDDRQTQWWDRQSPHRNSKEVTCSSVLHWTFERQARNRKCHPCIRTPTTLMSLSNTKSKRLYVTQEHKVKASSRQEVNRRILSLNIPTIFVVSI